LEEFPGIPATTPQQSSAGSASVTTLPSGLTVVTENSSAVSTISLTYPNAGSSSETTPGTSIANKYLTFKSGSGLSSLVILRNFENDGATPFATAGRFGATVGYTASKDKAMRLMPLLATNCSFEKWDVKAAMDSVKVEAAQVAKCAETTLSESLFAAAYGAHSATGCSLYSTSATVPSIQSFREGAYVLNGAVLAATGISDHEAFVKAAEEGFSESAVGESTSTPASAFIGGESRVHTPGAAATYTALGFEAPSSASTALLNVVKHCISVSSGGEVSALSTGGSGMVAVYGKCAPTDAAGVTDAICSLITSAPSADVVEIAKSLAKAEAMFNVESDGSKALVGSMTASVLETGSFSGAGLGAAYDAVSAADVKAAFEAMAKGNLALATTGDIASVPYQGTLMARFA